MAKVPAFNHPFQPYSIQVEFMRAVYDCIENRQVGVFESPTGTVSVDDDCERRLIVQSTTKTPPPEERQAD